MRDKLLYSPTPRTQSVNRQQYRTPPATVFSTSRGASAAILVIMLWSLVGRAEPPQPAKLIKEVARKDHPYLLFADWEETPGFKHRKEKPYGGRLGWLFYVKVHADRNPGMPSAFYYQVTKDDKYWRRARDTLMGLGEFRGDRIRFGGVKLIDLALTYDWIQELLTEKEDEEIKARLARFADAVWRKYPRQPNAIDRIMGASGLGAIALALAGYKPETRSKPVDWLRDATISLFVKDRFQFPQAFREIAGYEKFCPALRGVCNKGGFDRMGGYQAYWLSTLCKWLLIYWKATGRNPLDDFPIARGVVNQVIWASMPNRMDSQQNTRNSGYWLHYKFLLSMLSPEERGAFAWYAEDPKVDRLRWRRRSAGLDGVPWGLACYEKKLPTKKPSWTSFYSPSCEAVVFRRGWLLDSDWLFFKCMNQPIPSHRDMLHHDNMTFEFYSRGDYLLSDGGEVRGRMRGYGPAYAIGHNNLIIDGAGPVKEAVSQLYYRFVNPAYFVDHSLERWLEFVRAKMKVSYVEVDPIKLVVRRGKKEFTARKLDSPVLWTRIILYPGKEYFIVVDRVKSTGKHRYELIFHLSSLRLVETEGKEKPGHVLGELSVAGKKVEWAKAVRTDILTGDRPLRWIAEFPGNGEVVWRTINLAGKGVEFRLARSPAADKIRVGRIWGRLPDTVPPFSGDQEVDHPFVSFLNETDSFDSIIALLAHYSEGEKPRAFSSPQVSAGTSSLLVQSGSISDLVVTGKGKIKCEKLSADAELAFVRQNGNELEIAFLVDGRRLSLNGEEIISASESVLHIGANFNGNGILAHISTPAETTVSLKCKFKPQSVLYKPEPPDWIWVWTDELKKKYSWRPLKFAVKGGKIQVNCPAGLGKISVRR